MWCEVEAPADEAAAFRRVSADGRRGMFVARGGRDWVVRNRLVVLEGEDIWGATERAKRWFNELSREGGTGGNLLVMEDGKCGVFEGCWA